MLLFARILFINFRFLNIVWSALKYLYNPKQPEGQPTPYVIVTVLVDEVQFTQVTPKVNKSDDDPFCVLDD